MIRNLDPNTYNEIFKGYKQKKMEKQFDKWKTYGCRISSEFASAIRNYEPENRKIFIYNKIEIRKT